MLTERERLRALFGNIKNHPWDVIPQFKLEKEDAEVLLNATKEMQSELLRVQAAEVHS
ncbi:hypothetical protein [Butyrivibrio sp. INlla21]|uniref:hypothetical protein n=1 Tax=Butyrivibrio sp. INlla21 TaxID=1520811 RepID=UPI0008E67CC7|nr:hypothetical protein [Butyrivibrio sp. INlla21]SFU57049.1 hypothetical protein SAMN02910342_00923 [Butyrivibrio sp. INlla21]